MRARFLIVGTLVGGTLLTLLGFVTAGILPPRYKPFKDPHAVAETIRANAPTDDIYTAPDGLFVAVSLRPASADRRSFVPHLAGQVAVEFAVASGLSVLLLAIRPGSPLGAACVLGLTGLVAGVEVHFPEWNWAGFPSAHFAGGSVIWLRTGSSRASSWAL
jgi:hypothetical protein